MGNEYFKYVSAVNLSIETGLQPDDVGFSEKGEEIMRKMYEKFDSWVDIVCIKQNIVDYHIKYCGSPVEIYHMLVVRDKDFDHEIPYDNNVSYRPYMWKVQKIFQFLFLVRRKTNKLFLVIGVVLDKDLQFDGLARIPGLTQAQYKTHPQSPNSVPRSLTSVPPKHQHSRQSRALRWG